MFSAMQRIKAPDRQGSALSGGFKGLKAFRITTHIKDATINHSEFSKFFLRIRPVALLWGNCIRRCGTAV
jgi:hypothetical protein